MQHVKSELSLTNLNVVNGRVEEYQPTILFDAVTSRAFSNLKNMMSLTQHTLQKKWYVVGDEIKRCQRRIGSIRKESIHTGSA
jgi:16S rRNA G527 N7-methylase RsmG